MTATLTSSRPALPPLVLPLGDGAIQITDGYAQWSNTQRPRRKALTEYQGSNPISQTIPFMFDGHSAEQSVEAGIALLESLSSPTGTDDNPGPPPTFTVDCSVMRHTDLEYYVSALAWGAPYWDDTIGCTRQPGVLTITEYVADQFLIDIVASASAPGAGGYKNVVVKKGDTLAGIARRFMPKKATAKQVNTYIKKIQDANPKSAKLPGLRDPKSLAKYVGIKPGIRVPIS